MNGSPDQGICKEFLVERKGGDVGIFGSVKEANGCGDWRRMFARCMD